MKTTIWTVTTDGENSGIETTVHKSRELAEKRLRRDLRSVGLENTPSENLEEVWTREHDGACIIERHVVDVDMVTL